MILVFLNTIVRISFGNNLFYFIYKKNTKEYIYYIRSHTTSYILNHIRMIEIKNLNTRVRTFL